MLSAQAILYYSIYVEHKSPSPKLGTSWINRITCHSIIVRHRSVTNIKMRSLFSGCSVHSIDKNTSGIGTGIDVATHAVLRDDSNDADFRINSGFMTTSLNSTSASVSELVQRVFGLKRLWWYNATTGQSVRLSGEDLNTQYSRSLKCCEIKALMQKFIDYTGHDRQYLNVLSTELSSEIEANEMVYNCCYRRVLSLNLMSDLIDFMHSGLTGSHSGVAKTVHQLSRLSWWCGCKGNSRCQVKHSVR